MSNVIRWRYVCTAATDALKYHLSYPRAPSVPGTQQVCAARPPSSAPAAPIRKGPRIQGCSTRSHEHAHACPRCFSGMTSYPHTL
jgi:hypothetical protein